MPDTRIKALLNSESYKRRTLQQKAYLNSENIYIYGAGNAGSSVHAVLKAHGKTVAGFFDKNASTGNTFKDAVPVIPVSRLGETGKKNQDLIIIAVFCNAAELAEIRNKLEQTGWKKITYFHGIALLLEEENPMLRLSDMMGDNKSIELLTNYLNAVSEENPDLFSAPESAPQYFDTDIPLSKGYSRFVDCGAFDGDSIMELQRQHGTVEAIACFEPDENNFRKLSRRVQDSRPATTQILFPCGVWKDTRCLHFKSGLDSTSSISQHGDTIIQCTSIDEAIPNFKPSFIKMDIEGAELEALSGASTTIKETVPDLAISIYHKPEHIWQIPFAIAAIYPGYLFYLRSHAYKGLESIAYASDGINKKQKRTE